VEEIMSGLLGVLCTVACLMAQTPVRPATPQMIAVEDSNGRPRLAVQARERPYEPGGRLAGAIYITERKDARDKHGLIVSGIGFYPWLDGPRLHMSVFELVPRPGHTNRYWADSTDNIKQHLTPMFLVDYELVAGKRREVVEMKALGLTPLWLTRQ
jgi:hypothetical protein